MSNPISEDCSSGLHDYCTPCECKCHIEYHTINELYDHRRALTAALLNIISNECPGGKDPTFKSKLHSDGTMFEGGYFICGLNYDGPEGLITYHYSLEYWNQFRIPELERAPEYDGHTSQDVIERLLKL